MAAATPIRILGFDSQLFWQAGFQLINIIFFLFCVVISIYMIVLLVRFLKAGTEAFRIYIRKNG